MSKKTFTAAIIITAFLISIVSGMQAVWVVKAVPPYSTPAEPNKDPPLVTIQSPINGTSYAINAGNVELNFTITQPSSWNGSCTIKEISYQLDGQDFIVWNGTVYAVLPLAGGNLTEISYALPVTSEFSTTLMVNVGEHTMSLNVYTESDYFPSTNFTVPTIYPIYVNQTVHFTVISNQPNLINQSVSFTPSPTPTLHFSASPVPTPTQQPTPSPSPSPTSTSFPSESPTQQPTLEPSPTSNNTQENLTPILIIVGIVVVLVAVAEALFYFKKRRGIV